jgi:hypothetical protein
MHGMKAQEDGRYWEEIFSWRPSRIPAIADRALTENK